MKVKHIALSSQNNVSKIYTKLDDCKAGLNIMNTNNFARQHLWVSIENPIDLILLILGSNQIKTHLLLKELNFH